MCLWGRGACSSSCPLLAPPACPVPGGQGVLAQLLSACTNTRLSASPRPRLCLPLLTRQVWPGGGQAGVQDAWVSASHPSRAPGPFAPRSCFARVPAPPPGVSSSSIKRACTEPSVGCSVASFCVIGLLSASVGRPLLGFLLYLVPGSSKPGSEHPEPCSQSPGQEPSVSFPGPVPPSPP